MISEFEYILRKTPTAEVLRYVENTPGAFEELIELALSDKEPACWRAASILKDAIKKNDERLVPYIESFVNVLENKKDGHQRELLKILFKMSPGDEHFPYLFDFCVNAWKDATNQSSLRHVALKYLLHIANQDEAFSSVIHDLNRTEYLESLSQGIRRSVKKWLDDFEHLKKR